MYDFSTITVDGIDREVAAAVETAELLAESVTGVTETRTYENTITPLDQIIDVIRKAQHHTEFMRQVHPEAEVRDAATTANDVLKTWWQFPEAPWSVELAFRPEIYRAVEQFAATQEATTLVGEERMFLDMIQAHLRLVGHDLKPERQSRLKEMSDQLLSLSTQFEKNIADDTSYMLIGEDDLDGLPASYVGSLARDEEGGQYKVTMAYPDYVPFVENSSRRDLREKIRLLYSSRASMNKELLTEIVSLRLKIARLLGYDSWADRVLETRMARTKDNVDKMYDSLIPPLEQMGHAEIEKVSQLLQADTGDDQVQVWDWSYYDTQIRKNEYGVDPTRVSEYFPLQAVLDGMFALTSEVFGVNYETVETPVWHPDVLAYKVTDTVSEALIGHFYLDLHPREGKYSHAAVFPGVPGRRLDDGSYQAPITAMVCNFTKPTERVPSLLQHSEVETLFHEFGHVIHDLFGHCELARFSGAYTEWDFVEAPSQIMQHWTWQVDVLQRFARHHETGDVIPQDLVEGLVAARQLNNGMFYLRQIQFGLLDQALHGPEEEKNLDELTRQATEVSLLPHVAGTFFPASFGHLVGGYDAAYYGYIWSEVFGDDMFSRFEEEGVTSPEVGMEYRTEVIGRGGSLPAREMLVNFLHRQPNNEAFLRKVGI